jgi:hypothetical protein
MRCRHGLQNKQCRSRGSLLLWSGCGEEMVSALWFGSQAKRDAAAVICGVTLVAVVPRQSASRDRQARAKTPTPNVFRKSGMRQETTVVRRRGEACMRLHAQERKEKNSEVREGVDCE